MQPDDLFNQDYYPSTSNLEQNLYSPNSQPFASLQDDYGFGDLGEFQDSTLGIDMAQEEQEDEEEADSTPTSSTSLGDGTKKKGGRPRDRVWELFEGDRTLATCRYCDWKSEHPKTFGMRAHVKACENVPEDKKLEFKQLEQAKREAKKLQKEASTRQRTVSKETAEAVKAGIEKKKKVAKEKAELESAKKAKSLEASPPAAGPSSPPKKRLKMDQETMNPGGRGIENDFDLYSTSTRLRMATASTSIFQSAPPAPPVQAPPPRSPITCHVLDSTVGKPAPEIRIRLDRLNPTGFVLQGQSMTDKDGRCNNLLPPQTVLETGIYKITFFTSEYFTQRGMKTFYPFVEVPFNVDSPQEHYHIPLLLSPFAFSSYRGS